MFNIAWCLEHRFPQALASQMSATLHMVPTLMWKMWQKMYLVILCIDVMVICTLIPYVTPLRGILTTIATPTASLFTGYCKRNISKTMPLYVLCSYCHMSYWILTTMCPMPSYRILIQFHVCALCPHHWSMYIPCTLPYALAHHWLIAVRVTRYHARSQQCSLSKSSATRTQTITKNGVSMSWTSTS